MGNRGKIRRARRKVASYLRRLETWKRRGKGQTAPRPPVMDRRVQTSLTVLFADLRRATRTKGHVFETITRLRKLAPIQSHIDDVVKSACL